jgi:hypothetical protein
VTTENVSTQFILKLSKPQLKYVSEKPFVFCQSSPVCCKKIMQYFIGVSLSQSDPIKRLPLYIDLLGFFYLVFLGAKNFCFLQAKIRSCKLTVAALTKL